MLSPQVVVLAYARLSTRKYMYSGPPQIVLDKPETHHTRAYEATADSSASLRMSAGIHARLVWARRPSAIPVSAVRGCRVRVCERVAT